MIFWSFFIIKKEIALAELCSGFHHNESLLLDSLRIYLNSSQAELSRASCSSHSSDLGLGGSLPSSPLDDCGLTSPHIVISSSPNFIVKVVDDSDPRVLDKFNLCSELSRADGIEVLPPSILLSEEKCLSIKERYPDTELALFLQKHEGETITLQICYDEIDLETFNSEKYKDKLEELSLVALLIHHLDGQLANYAIDHESESPVLIDFKDTFPLERVLGERGQFLIRDGLNGNELTFSYNSELSYLPEFQIKFDDTTGLVEWFDSFMEKVEVCIQSCKFSNPKFADNIATKIQGRAKLIKSFLSDPESSQKTLYDLDLFICPFKKDVLNFLKIFNLDENKNMFFEYFNFGVEGLLKHYVFIRGFDSSNQDHIEGIGIFIEKLCVNLGCLDEGMVRFIANYLSEIKGQEHEVLNDKTRQLFERIYQKITLLK